jgi:hypothetical protein
MSNQGLAADDRKMDRAVAPDDSERSLDEVIAAVIGQLSERGGGPKMVG